MAVENRRWSGSELRNYMQANFPDWRVITRKPTNHQCTIINRKTGVSIERPSNYMMVEYVTSAGFQSDNNFQGFGLQAYDDTTARKNSAVKAAEYALYWIEETGEHQGCLNLRNYHLTVREGKLLLIIGGVEYGKP